MRIIDSHAHYDDEAFDADREELIKSCKEQGIEYIVTLVLWVFGLLLVLLLIGIIYLLVVEGKYL